jgi:hypothetical protein
MADEPQNLALEHLRILRADMQTMRADMQTNFAAARRVLDEHTLKLDFLDERIETLREGALTAIGFAASTGAQQKKLEKQIAEPAERVGRLEKARPA